MNTPSPAAWGGVEFTEDGGLTLSFAQPAHPMSTNGERRASHWSQVKKAVTPWRDVTWLMTRWALAKMARERGLDGWPQPVTVQVSLAFRSARTRDPHNYTGTVVKAVVDGLVRGQLIPDDNPEWATILEPTLVIQTEKTRPLMAHVIITPRRDHDG